MGKGSASEIALTLFFLTAVYAAPTAGLAQSMTYVPETGILDLSQVKEALEGYQATGGATGSPPTGASDNPAAAELIRRAEIEGADVNRMTEAAKRAEPQGMIEFQNFNPMDYADPRELKKAIMDRMREEGFTNEVFEALERGDVDQSARSWLIEHGADADMVEVLIRKEPATEDWVTDQAHRYGYDQAATLYKLSTESDMRNTIADHAHERAITEKQVEVLRTTE